MPQPKCTRAEFDAAVAKATEMDWIRLAAFIDSEGTIFIGRTMNKSKRYKGQRGLPQHILTVSVANTDMRLHKWLSDTFTGTVYIVGIRGGVNKQCHSWKVHEQRAATLLEKCMPYFIMKREQAEVALAYRALRDQGSKGRKLTNDDVQARDGMYRKIRSLNSPHLVEFQSKVSGE
jgi:hypothetical protein